MEEYLFSNTLSSLLIPLINILTAVTDSNLQFSVLNYSLQNHFEFQFKDSQVSEFSQSKKRHIKLTLRAMNTFCCAQPFSKIFQFQKFYDQPFLQSTNPVNSY